MNEINLCPFCNSGVVEMTGGGHAFFRVTCARPYCRAAGPYADTESAAIAAWNRAGRFYLPEGEELPDYCECCGQPLPEPPSE